MVHKILMLVALMFAASLPVQGNEPVRLCHIANAGFMAKSENAAVLVDAVIKKDAYGGTYAVPSSETLEAIQQSGGLFNTVKLALITHKHADHFDAEASLKHLRQSPAVEYIMPPQAYELMQAAGMTEAEESRVHAILPDWKSGPEAQTIAGIPVEAYRIDHGAGRPQNIGYRFKLSDTWFFHTGDISASQESLKAAGLANTPVDVMMIPFWYILENKADIMAAWDIDTMVPIHYQKKRQPWMDQFGGPEGVVEAVTGEWPGARRISGEMQCETVN